MFKKYSKNKKNDKNIQNINIKNTLKFKMIDSLNALSAKFDIANIKTDAEYKYMKKYIKENYCKNLLSTSQYFNFLDEENPQNVNNRKRYYFDIASKTAHRSNMFQKHGAIIVYKKNIISKGFNMYKGNSKNIYSMHAEIVAINNAIKNKHKEILSECELYVVRIGSNSMDNLLKYSKPCINCQKYINKFNIKKIFYSTNDEFENYYSN